GRIIYPAGVTAINDTLAKGCWSETESFGAASDWQAEKIHADGSHFSVLQAGETVAEVNWQLSGDHNMNNALAAMLAARHVGVTPEVSARALAEFTGIKRR